MPWALIAVAAIQAGFSIYQQQQQRQAAQRAERQAASDMAQNQSNLLLEQQRERRRAQGTVLGGANQRSQAMSQQGSILTSTPQNRSLLGG